MIDVLKTFFIRHNINYKIDKFVLCVSCGIDSMCMLNLFLKLVNKDNIIVVHINHNKRKQSEEEEKYIRNFCLENDIKLYVEKLHFDSTNNFQMIARNKRYEFFDKVMKEENAKYLCLAHHADDNLETILMRICRGSSLTGYSGIRSIYPKDDYFIIRPLINVSKDEINNYQKQENFKYYLDNSNLENTYTRNRFRNIIIPLIKEESEDLLNKVFEFSDTLYNASIIVNEKRDAFISEYVKVTKCDISINKIQYLKLNEYMKLEVLFEVLKKYNLSKQNIIELIKIVNTKNGSFKTNFKNLFVFSLDYDKICINHHFEKTEEEYVSVVVNQIKDYKLNDNFYLTVRKKEPFEVLSKGEICYNSCNLPVTIRTRKPKDTIKLKCGTKKIKDLFIDMKIPKENRSNIFLLEKDGQILNIFNVRKSILLKDDDKCDIIFKVIKK